MRARIKACTTKKNNESVAIMGAQSGIAQLTSPCPVSWTVFIAFKMVSSPKASDDATASKYHAVNLCDRLTVTQLMDYREKAMVALLPPAR